MRNLLICLSLFALFSCEEGTTRCFVCNREQSEKVAEFVSDKIKDSNNMADEEMEDVIRELKKTAISLYCKQKFVETDWNDQVIYNKLDKDSSKTYHFNIW